MHMATHYCGAFSAALVLLGGPAGALEQWTGTMRTESERIYMHVTPGVSCTDAWESAFRFVVGEDGSVEGDGRAELVEGPRCPWPLAGGLAKAVDFKVEGEKTPGGFRVRLAFVRNVPATGVNPLTGIHMAAFLNMLVSNPGQGGANPPGPPIELARTSEAAAEGETTIRGTAAPYNDPLVARSTLKLVNCAESGKPKDAADELPILLGQLFGSLSHSWDPMELYPSGERKLQSILPELKAALDGNSGKFRCGRPAVTVVIGKEPNADDLFLEGLNRARRDALKNWFAERGIDTSQVDWKMAFGPEDDVQVKFGR
jgi:hypothetical protein